MTTEQEVAKLVKTVNSMQTDMSTMSGHMLHMAEKMYGDEDDEEDEKVDDMRHKAKKAKALKALAKEDDDDDGDADDMMPYDEDDMKEYKAFKRFKALDKGYNNASKDRKDEEDSSFGESPGSDVKGNEPHDPAEEVNGKVFDGDTEDETFNVSAMKLQLEGALDTVNKMAGRQTIVKALIPGSGDANKGREPQMGDILTRDMEVATKKASYKDINRLRIQTGDLQEIV